MKPRVAGVAGVSGASGASVASVASGRARRGFLRLLSAGPVAAAGVAAGGGPAAADAAAANARPAGARIGDGRIELRFDGQARSMVAARVGGAGQDHAQARWQALTGWDDGETLSVVRAATRGARSAPAASAVPGDPDAPQPPTPAEAPLRFTLESAHHEPMAAGEPHGAGQRLRLLARSPEGIEKAVTVSLHDAFPGFALLTVRYRHLGREPLEVVGWSNASHHLLRRAGEGDDAFWSYSGATHEDRRDWMRPVRARYRQANFLGMVASDYGGGTPIVDVWRRSGGLAVGHVEREPRLVSLPVEADARGVRLGMRAEARRRLLPGETLETPETFIAVHAGDCFATLDAYRRLMAERGLAAPRPPDTAYEPIWCAWGYEREFSIERVVATLPKVRELGFKWAVLDDGWQRLTGDWVANIQKFPNGEADLRSLVSSIRAQGLRPRLWIAPLAVAPGSDALHRNPDRLLLNADGATQNVTWWNSYTLCPAYDKTIEDARALVRTIIGDWGFDGLKIDGQHLNAVAPCHNPAHRHARPEESVERMAGFFQAMYDEARRINPDAVMELCPCGTAYAFHTMPAFNQAPASDPLSSWQVRSKGKALKALMGPWAAYAGDHVELSDGGRDFASTVGIGAVPSTKFTWPVDPKPKDSFLLTPEREQAWRHWTQLYLEHDLARGRYRGELYDVAFDKPETHAVQKGDRLYYAFYAKQWNGTVQLRGLEQGRWRVRDYVNGRELGAVSAERPELAVAFEGALLLLAERA